ncbi:ATP-binding protein [Phaeobacter sp. J2-8]|uniref:HAMP domain-containing sensor histidine kinase n=1 Tax=Phaeobacter sp. J2-8 TaxID=2931394 RepID=UPI001FD5C9DA|nr:ATP-binding protein [Phaeobacter sp. J2-8]MCJ7873278.1 ATP-binding protein [Phaeobacter sp. J2-8]
MFKLGRMSRRLSLQFAFLYSLLSALVFVGAYWFTNYEVRDWLHDQMDSDRGNLSEVLREEGVDALALSIDVLTRVNFENARIFQLADADGRVLAGNIRRVTGRIENGYFPVENLEIDGEHGDEISGYWITSGPIGPYVLLQGTGNHVIAEVLEALAISLVSGFILIMVLGSFVGVWVGRLTGSRIEVISGTMEVFSRGELTARIPNGDEGGDDLSVVATRINRMLGRLENLIESQVQITNDIAHDLRTPLQRLRQRLERMATRDRVDPNDAHVALEQAEDIINTFNALLRIAQIEAGDRRERFRATDLNDLAVNVFDAFEPSAEQNGQQLRVTTFGQPVTMLADPDLLMQLISNLTENALRHTPKDTVIEIAVSRIDGAPVLTVSDNGPGLRPEDREKVFRRFYRGEKSRTTGGNGLGLSLCKAIAELHHATIHLSDRDPGLRVEINFAKASPPV